MNIKQWLSRAYYIDKAIESKMEQIQMWQNLAEKITTSVSIIPTGGNTGSRVEDLCIKIIDSEREIKSKINDLVIVKQQIQSLISLIDNDTSRVLLEQRYILCKDWDSISDFLGYSEDYTKRELHNQALKAANKFHNLT